MDSSKWQMQALRGNDTFKPTLLSRGRKTVGEVGGGGRWVFAVKRDPHGEKKHKARFVAKGYCQVADIVYHETFSPSAHLTSIRTFMQLQ